MHRRNKAIDSLSQETKDLCEKRRTLRKNIGYSKIPYKSTIQEYKIVNYMVTKEVKKLTRKQLDDKIRSWNIIFKRTIHIICSNQHVNWKGKLKIKLRMRL